MPRLRQAVPRWPIAGVNETLIDMASLFVRARVMSPRFWDSRFCGNDMSCGGHTPLCETVVADFTPLYPPYSLYFARVTHRGVQRGLAPLPFFYPPRLGDQGG